MRDLLRGRLSGRLDIERIIGAANLPQPIAQTVRAVVRRTRLWKLERVDVAHELVAHFQDGLEAGATADELVAAFGDARQAGRLMRRAKIRGRGPVWKAWSLSIRTLAAVFLVCFAIYCVQAVRVFTAKPVLKLNVLETINRAALATPEDQRAWPVYRAAALATTKPPTGLDLRDVHPGHEDWGAAVAYVKKNAEVVEQVRRAAARPRIGVIYSIQSDPELDTRFEDDRESKLAEARARVRPREANPLSIGITLPQLSILREAAQLLRIDATIAAEAGDADRVMSDLTAMLGIVNHSEQMPFLISDLVSLAVLGMTTETTGRVLADHADVFSDAQLAQLSHHLAGARDGQLTVDIASERMFFEDVLQRLYSDDGHGDGILVGAGNSLLANLSSDGVGGAAFSPEQIAAPAMSLVLAGRADMQAKYDAILNLAMAESHRPLWLRDQSEADAAAIRLSSNLVSRVRYLPLTVLMPSLSRAGAMGWLAVQRRDAALTAIALVLYRREYGDWPDSLNTMSPRYLPTVPPDQFDGRPIKYTIVDGRPLLYSIGADRKDDGGRIDTGPTGHYRASHWIPAPAATEARQDPSGSAPTTRGEIADGDWVLWPPVD
jgi:hypothetical protein